MGQDQKQELLNLFFEDSLDALAEWERVGLRLQPGDSVSLIEPIFRCAHNIKGGAGLVALTSLYERLHHFEDFLVALREHGGPLTMPVIEALLDLENTLRHWLRGLKADSTYAPDTTALEAELHRLTARLKASEPTDAASAAPAVKFKPVATATPREDKPDETLRVAASKLDELIQLVGEMSLHQAILERAAREGTLDSPTARGAIEVKAKLTQDLRDTALSLRMVPIENLFQRIERVVRETAGQLGKTVSVVRRGDDVTLDKLVVERMLDPLIHIARNALDHGIETTAERERAGKRAGGLITLSAEHAPGGINLVFEDDGRGIDGEKVYRRAVERNLIPENASMGESAKQNLIFMAGLSTAEKVSDISGRGVGMDVVADVVGKMAGRVDLVSALGQGTRLSINLPTNLSIVNALIIEVGGAQYAIPNQELAEVVDLREHRPQSVQAGLAEAFHLRGRLVPLESMSAFLVHHGHKAEREGLRDDFPQPGILVRHRDSILALRVGKVVGQQQIFVRPVIGALKQVSLFGGSTILSDGEPSLILNLSEMARLYFEADVNGASL